MTGNPKNDKGGGIAYFKSQMEYKVIILGEKIADRNIELTLNESGPLIEKEPDLSCQAEPSCNISNRLNKKEI